MMHGMKASLKKNQTGIMLMLVSSVCVCIGQLYWKLSNAEHVVLLGMGFLLYGVGAIIMLVAYRHGSLSVLQPVLSMNYVLSLALGYAILNEQITFSKIAGVLIIIAGVGLIGGGDE